MMVMGFVKTRLFWPLAVLLSVFSLTLRAAESDKLEISVTLSSTRESLTNSQADWHDDTATITLSRQLKPIAYLVARETARFALKDREIGGGGVLRPTKSITVELEATTSDTHRFLPKTAFGGQATFALNDGWVVGGGMVRRRYNTSNATIANVAIDRYEGAWRFGYTGYLAKATATAYSSSHRISTNYYMNDAFSLGLSTSYGIELENLPNLGIRSYRTRSQNASAHWAVTPDAALTCELTQQSQGDFFTRRGVRLAARIGF